MKLSEMIIQNRIARTFRANWSTPLELDNSIDYRALTEKQIRWLDTMTSGAGIYEVGHLIVGLDSDDNFDNFDPFNKSDLENALEYVDEICDLYSVKQPSHGGKNR